MCQRQHRKAPLQFEKTYTEGVLRDATVWAASHTLVYLTFCQVALKFGRLIHVCYLDSQDLQSKKPMESRDMWKDDKGESGTCLTHHGEMSYVETACLKREVLTVTNSDGEAPGVTISLQK